MKRREFLGLAASAAVTRPMVAKAATPVIVFSGVTDPVGADLVASLARPGGNATGVSDISSKLTPRRLELVSELVPQATVIALLVNPNNNAVNEPMIEDVQDTARAKNIQLSILNASSDSQIDAAFASVPRSIRNWLRWSLS